MSTFKHSALSKFYTKNTYWIWPHFFVFVMLGMLILHPAYWELLTPYAGYTAIGFLFVTLALSPIKTLQPQWMLITKLSRHKRELGVAVFSFAAIHVLCFIIKRGGVMETLPYALHPALISVVWISFPIFFLLAITSNQSSVKKMGFLKWKKLHRTVYWAEVGIIIHMIFVGEAIWASIIFLPLVFLQGVIFRSRRRKEPPF
jgi:sulfoxide reductase heme-binding subunit YedZ